MGQPPVSRREAERHRRDSEAVDLRALGLSYQAIADRLGITTRAGAYKAVARGIGGVHSEKVDELRTIAALQLDDIYRRTLEIFARRHPVLHQGEVVNNPTTGEPFDDDGIKLDALRTLLRVQESVRKFHGLDAPKSVEVTGKNGAAIKVDLSSTEFFERVKAAVDGAVISQESVLPPLLGLPSPE